MGAREGVHRGPTTASVSCQMGERPLVSSGRRPGDGARCQVGSGGQGDPRDTASRARGTAGTPPRHSAEPAGTWRPQPTRQKRSPSPDTAWAEEPPLPPGAPRPGAPPQCLTFTSWSRSRLGHPGGAASAPRSTAWCNHRQGPRGRGQRRTAAQAGKREDPAHVPHAGRPRPAWNKPGPASGHVPHTGHCTGCAAATREGLLEDVRERWCGPPPAGAAPALRVAPARFLRAAREPRESRDPDRGQHVALQGGRPPKPAAPPPHPPEVLSWRHGWFLGSHKEA